MIPEEDRQMNIRIDAVLEAVGSAVPPAGIEGRILTRLAAERVSMDRALAGLDYRSQWRPAWAGAVRRFSAPTLGLASAGVVCAAIVIGSVSYSHRVRSIAVPVPGPVQAPSQGIGAASAMHPAAPASAPVAAGPESRGRSAHHAGHGRARVQPHARKAPGVAVPAPSAAPEN